ncbi:hypothetical protein MGYG_05705 [Nannizzia gypsea CBS 118893]|uniref:Haloacid dehalogenase n=1 Tax=Arthroderma gypseum (strain ATCC MYA-4604 / CBS 118893) TaxID=535722 RepID=E4UXC0_ARTGP|nr:hypothetical protein MGYG_05705 [Nannizzia gypsea CBS 118893]EFR02707.1 hypothetical protein MGYG_05705 [Nannizzia gypsea CBS 118893]
MLNQIAKAAGFISQNVTAESVQAAFKVAYKQESALRPNYGRNTSGFGGPREWWANVIRGCFARIHIENESGGGSGTGVAREVPASLVADILQRFESKEGYALFEDVEVFFGRLKSWKKELQEKKKAGCLGNDDIHNVIIGVVSNSDDRVSPILRSLGLSVGNAWADSGELLPRVPPSIPKGEPELNDVDFIVTSYEAREEKPHRHIFDIAKSRAKEHLLVTDPSCEVDGDWRRIHIGDDYGDDYQGAINAGWESFLLLRDGMDYLPGTDHRTIGGDVNTLHSLNDVYSQLNQN